MIFNNAYDNLSQEECFWQLGHNNLRYYFIHNDICSFTRKLAAAYTTQKLV